MIYYSGRRISENSSMSVDPGDKAWRVHDQDGQPGGKIVGLSSRRVLTALERVEERSSKASVC
jgi:hypothetical protein